jgi:multidrug resistance efflux pump
MSKEIDLDNKPKTGIKKALLGLAIVAVLAAAVMGSRIVLEEKAAAIATFPVKQGEFVITLTLKNGEMGAVESVQINAPRVRGQLKITKLFPEGDIVDVGDLVIEFDKAEFEKRVTEAEQGLEAARAELEKTLANQGVEIGRQESDIENKTAELRLAQLQVEKMEFESLVEKEEAKLKGKQAELALAQAARKLEAQQIVDQADRKKRNLEEAQKQRDLDKSKKDLESLSVFAESPGLVVYEKIWKGSRPEKIRVGDEPWGGATLVTLPDLSKMEVKTYVNEVDVDKLKVGQKVRIKLDALPEPIFHGAITSIAALGHEKEGDKNVKVFDIEIELEEVDKRLKPGMSATSEVVIETVPQSADTLGAEEVAPASSEEEFTGFPLYIPIDAVFERGGKTLVYRMVNGKSVQQEVVLSKRNENFVIVEEGLGPDDRVALRDPTLVLENLGGMAEEEDDAEQSVSMGE